MPPPWLVWGLSWLGLLLLLEGSQWLLRTLLALGQPALALWSLDRYGQAVLTWGVLVGTLMLVEWLRPGSREPRHYGRGVYLSLVALLLTTLYMPAITALTAALPAAPLLVWRVPAGASLGTTALSSASLLGSLALFDLLYYWFHRAQHWLPWLWRFHQVHHALNPVNCLNAFHHVLEDAWRVPTMTVPLAWLLRLDVPQVFLLSAFLTAWGYYIHTDTALHAGPLRGLVADNVYHRLHHSRLPHHYDRNFAAFFPVWDWLFGTYARAVPGMYPPVGLDAIPPPSRLRPYLLLPFRAAGR